VTVLGTPFRLGSTSYIWPAGLVPNARQLGPLVDDVELVLFDSDGNSNLPDSQTVRELNELAQAHHLSYTVHLPLDLSLAHPRSLEKARKVIACTRDLEPWAYVLHLDGRLVEADPNPVVLARWQEQALDVLELVAALVGDARRLAVENLENYRPECYLPLLEQVPVSLCVDAGHLWLVGREPVPFLAKHLDRTRVIHLHGVGDRDHQSLAHQGLDRVRPVLDLLRSRRYEGVVTLEVFGRPDFFSSRELVIQWANGAASSAKMDDSKEAGAWLQ
jgi:sugar phosphate isomerase/epimerase